MRNKRGLSQVVTTLLLVLLIMVAIGGIWLAVSALLDSGAEKINLDKFTLSLSLRKAVVDYDTGLAEVRVRRDSGEGDLKAIKFIVEDDRNSEIFEESFDEFPELAERTFTLNLSEAAFLTLSKVHKISIAPVFLTPSGNLKAGEIAGSIGELNRGINVTDGGDQGDTPTEGCSKDTDCGPTTYVEGSENCIDGTQVGWTEKSWDCINTFCDEVITYDVFKEDCALSSQICFDGECIAESLSCTPATEDVDCGVDGLDGAKTCNGMDVVQDYKNYTCGASNTCEVSIQQQVIETCQEGYVCQDGACFEELECTTNTECCEGEASPYCGRVCNDLFECENETVRNAGVVGTPWPPGINEYFDSTDLNSVDENDAIDGQTIIFPGSAETRCLNVKKFVHMNFNGIISYLQLNETTSAISAGDNYEVWETPFGCTKL